MFIFLVNFMIDMIMIPRITRHTYNIIHIHRVQSLFTGMVNGNGNKHQRYILIYDTITAVHFTVRFEV